MTIPLALVQSRELWLTGMFRYAYTYPAAIALAASEKVGLDALVTERFGLDQVESALRASRERPGSMKPLVPPREESSA